MFVSRQWSVKIVTMDGFSVCTSLLLGFDVKLFTVQSV